LSLSGRILVNGAPCGLRTDFFLFLVPQSHLKVNPMVWNFKLQNLISKMQHSTKKFHLSLPTLNKGEKRENGILRPM
jgi:hypothetical protein